FTTSPKRLAISTAERTAPHLQQETMMSQAPSKLAQLRELSVVVADTGDYDAIKRLRPVDCTTNPTLVKKALDLPVYAGLIERELQWGRAQSGDKQAIANAVVAIYIFTIVPEFLMRFLSWVMVRTLYRLRPHGIEGNVPDEGAALLVCNHVSYMDALILSATIPRPVRFVMYYKIFNIPVMRWIFRTAKAIPIAGAREDPALMQRAFDEVDAALADGELVCIFPEGALTRDGAMAAFKSGVEKILERRPVPVVPMALRGMWSSMWSRRDTRLGRMRVPRRFRATVEVVAAPAVDGHSTDAAALEAQVRTLRGDLA
ncbi:MAG: 1-acyl-sn-glycerol-3-phosphate acyltransferase, partial [Stenotrophomonas sp.]